MTTLTMNGRRPVNLEWGGLTIERENNKEGGEKEDNKKVERSHQFGSRLMVDVSPCFVFDFSMTHFLI